MTLSEHINALPDDRKNAMRNLHDVIFKNLPAGFKETISEKFISYCVPHSIYPPGYHCDPSKPLPFLSIASQKNFIALYHMGLYGSPELLKWFTTEYPKHSKGKLDMGKSCVRFKKPEEIPFDLIGELAGKLTPQQWIKGYEAALGR
jgi:hypothetical protein